MNETMVISIPALLAYSLILIFPVAIFRFLRLRLTTELLISMVRMAVQLGLVALYLEYIFRLDNFAVNAAWSRKSITAPCSASFKPLGHKRR